MAVTDPALPSPPKPTPPSNAYAQAQSEKVSPAYGNEAQRAFGGGEVGFGKLKRYTGVAQPLDQ